MAALRKVQLQTPSGSQIWRVTEARLPKNQHEKVYGLCSWEKKKVTIERWMSVEEKIQAAIHEAAHVALGEDFGESAIERVEVNAWVLIAPYIAELMED